MKKLKPLLSIVISFCLLLIIFSSCKDTVKEEEEVTTENTYSELTRFRGALSNLNLNDQKHIFNSLPNDVKYALWNERFKSRMEYSKSDKEKALLQKIIDHFPKNIYEDSLAKSDFHNFYHEIYSEALTAYDFDTTKLHTLYYRLGDNNSSAPIFIKGGLPDCDCNMKKDWCVLGNCTRGNCDSTNYGCGPSWLWKCNGTCQ